MPLNVGTAGKSSWFLLEVCWLSSLPSIHRHQAHVEGIEVETRWYCWDSSSCLFNAKLKYYSTCVCFYKYASKPSINWHAEITQRVAWGKSSSFQNWFITRWIKQSDDVWRKLLVEIQMAVYFRAISDTIQVSYHVLFTKVLSCWVTLTS